MYLYLQNFFLVKCPTNLKSGASCLATFTPCCSSYYPCPQFVALETLEQLGCSNPCIDGTQCASLSLSLFDSVKPYGVCS